MPHPKPEELIPINTECWWSRNGKPRIKVIIDEHVFRFNGDNFMHYEGRKIGQEGQFAFYHDDLTVISRPSS